MRPSPRITVAIVFAALAALEWGLGRIGYGHALAAELDPRFGFRLVPGQRAIDHGIAVELNSLGFRDREWGDPAASRPAGSMRVALLGNSVTFGLRVRAEETWGRVLEERLRAARPAEVMNFAVPGWVLEQMARAYEDVVRPFRPDVVVFTSFPNDLVPLPANAGRRPTRLRKWLRSTATWDFASRHLIRSLPSEDVADPDALAEKRAFEELRARVQSEPFGDDVAPYRQAAEVRLEGIRASVEADGGRLVVVGMASIGSSVGPAARRTAALWKAWAAARPSVVLIDPVPEFARALGSFAETMRDRPAL
ncbi:MAG TPA: hypothetical protein VKE69_09000, partial [Planctomycetota bacterium]|nr:hypothetical protein [Planctomycetota bacterium]